MDGGIKSTCFISLQSTSVWMLALVLGKRHVKALLVTLVLSRSLMLSTLTALDEWAFEMDMTFCHTSIRIDYKTSSFISSCVDIISDGKISGKWLFHCEHKNPFSV